MLVVINELLRRPAKALSRIAQLDQRTAPAGMSAAGGSGRAAPKEEVRVCRVGPGNFTPSPSQIRTGYSRIIRLVPSHEGCRLPLNKGLLPANQLAHISGDDLPPSLYAQREMQTSTLIHRHSPYRGPWCGRSPWPPSGPPCNGSASGAHGVDIGFTE